MFAALYCQFPALADVIELNEHHPQRHVVVKGDTLWDISAMFLKDPWRWPDVWNINQHIANPHLIYPGDIIYLVQGPSGPELRVQRADGSANLGPRVRVTDNSKAVPVIPHSAIQQFLDTVMVVDSATLDELPYIVSSVNEHYVNGAGDKVYVRGMEKEDTNRQYNVFRRGKTYFDPDSGQPLGRELLYLGDATVVRGGDPATALITRSKREILQKDYLVPASNGDVKANYSIVPAPRDVDGQIIAVVDGVTQIGQYQTTVINRGASDGVRVSQIFSIQKAGDTIKDPVTRLPITLPTEQAGFMMVFKTFDKVSYGLVLSATEAINIGDGVISPLVN